MRRWQNLAGCAVLSVLVASAAWAVTPQEVREARGELVRGLDEIDRERDAAIREARQQAEQRPNVFDDRRRQIVQRYAQQRDRLLDRYEQRLLGDAREGQVFGMNEPAADDREGRTIWLRQQLARVNGQIAEEEELHKDRMEQLTSLRGRGGGAMQQVNSLMERERDRHDKALRPLQQRRQELRQRHQEVRGETEADAGDPQRVNQLLRALEREINAGAAD